MVTFSQMANVASKTAELGASSSSSGNTISSKAEFGASVVSKTLDNLNSKKTGKSSGVSISYEAQKDILSAGMATKGIAISTKG